MRLFTALDISDDARARLAGLLRQLAPAAPFQWSEPDYLHITTKFIGRWPDADRDRVRGALAAIPKQGPIEIDIRGLGWFPNPHSPRALFAGIHAGPALTAPHQRTDDACAAIGVPAELKPFNAHLTLARVGGPDGLQALHQQIDAACAAIGIPAEAKPFNPHLTLARIKSPNGLPAVRQQIAQLDSTEFGQYTARAFTLYESVPSPGGSEYIKLEEFPLL